MNDPLTLWLRRMSLRGAATLDRLFGPRTPHALAILMYHRVTPVIPGVAIPTVNVRPDQFRRQMVGLLALGYHPWPLRTMLEQVRQGKPIPPKAMVVTFDDGYECVYTNAFPVLKELSIPATIFLATEYLDSEVPFPFDSWAATGKSGVPIDAWRPLKSVQAKEMLDSGLIELGTHTHTHADYRGRPRDFAEDLHISLGVLRRRFGLAEVALAFPSGHFDAPMLRVAREAGCQPGSGRQSGSGLLGALTTVNGLVRPHHDVFAWNRFTAFDDDTPAMMAAEFSGRYEAIRNFCRPGRTNPTNRPHIVGNAALGVPPFDISSS